MPVDMVGVESISAFELLRLALKGPEKSGKSRLASTGRKPILFLDYDCRREAIAGIPGVYAISFRDAQYPKVPDAAPATLSVLSALEQSLDLSKLVIKMPDGSEVRINPTPPPETFVKTIVNDSMATMSKAFRGYALAQNKDLRREISIGATKIYFVNGWDSWNAETGAVEPVIMRELALGVDVILIYHEAIEEAEDSTESSPKYTGRTTVFPVRYRSLIKFMNEVWAVKLVQKPVEEDGKTVYRMVPRVYPRPTSEFTMGATALLLDPEEDPDIAAMIAKHSARVASINHNKTTRGK
jgi:hypothetical protein